MRHLDEKNNNHKANYEFLTKTIIETAHLQLKFSEPFYYETENDGGTWINDLKIYQRSKVGFWEGAKYLIQRNDHGIAAYFFYYVVFSIGLFIPGYTFWFIVAEKLKHKFGDEMALVFGPVVGIAVMFLSTLLFLAVKINIFLYVYPVFALLLLAEFLRRKLYRNVARHRTVLCFVGLALALVFLVIVQRDFSYNLQYVGKYLDGLGVIPTDGYAGYFADNLFPWRIARVYYHDYSLADPSAVELLKATTVYEIG